MVFFPGGAGPWFCALLFNTSSSKSKKQTHLIAHTYPHLAADVLNNGDDKSFWVVMIKVGPFESWLDCLQYLHEWTLKTRGQKRRIERGIELYTGHCDTLGGLRFWVQHQEQNVLSQQRGCGKKRIKLEEPEPEEEEEKEPEPPVAPLEMFTDLLVVGTVRANLK